MGKGAKAGSSICIAAYIGISACEALEPKSFICCGPDTVDKRDILADLCGQAKLPVSR